MKVFIIKKRQLCMALFFIILLSAAFMFQIFEYNYRQANSKTYLSRDKFPPLIFLPDYQQGPPVYASASILIEAKSGAVLYAKNQDLRRAPASTTKMMTAIVALEKGDLNKVIQVSRRAAMTEGSSIWLRPGDKLTLRELLKGMMMQSGNDGSMAVAEGVAGDMENFVALMNIKAKELGALNTNFRNPHGLRAPSHYTTALDLAMIARYGLANPGFANLVKQKTAILKWQEEGKQVPISNTNRLLWYLEGADGVKTGTTNEAGYCLVASATRDHKQLIAVVLNSGDRWGDCARLLEYGFREFTITKIADSGKPLRRIKVVNGTRGWVNLYPRRDLIAVVKKGHEGEIRTQITVVNEEVSAPLKPGEALGKVEYRYLNNAVEGIDLINHQAVPVLRKRWLWW